MAASSDEGAVGRGGWLWLTRPPGWADDLAAIEAEDRERRASRAVAEQQGAGTALGRQAAGGHAGGPDTGRDGGGGAPARARSGAAGAGGGTTCSYGHRRTRRELETTVSELEEARAAAVRNLKDADAWLVTRATELKAVKGLAAPLEAEAPRPGAADAEAAPTGAGAIAEPEQSEPEGVVSRAPGADLGVVARDRTSGGGASSLADGLAGLAAALTDDGGEPVPATPAPVPTGAAATEAAAGGERRTPVPLPGGLLDDSVAAAEHLLRIPNAVLVVDGYNVTMTGWPELGAAEQRRRLVALLSEPGARTSTRVELVFDGAEVDGGTISCRPRPPMGAGAVLPARRRGRRGGARPGGPAPASRPVIVVSSDNRVRECAPGAPTCSSPVSSSTRWASAPPEPGGHPRPTRWVTSHQATCQSAPTT